MLEMMLKASYAMSTQAELHKWKPQAVDTLTLRTSALRSSGDAAAERGDWQEALTESGRRQVHPYSSCCGLWSGTFQLDIGPAQKASIALFEKGLLPTYFAFFLYPLLVAETSADVVLVRQADACWAAAMQLLPQPQEAQPQEGYRESSSPTGSYFCHVTVEQGVRSGCSPNTGAAGHLAALPGKKNSLSH